MAYGGGYFIAAGNAILISPDGVNWTSAGSVNNMSEIAYGGGKFAGVSWQGPPFDKTSESTACP
jgi:hypothetical protein